MTVIGFFLQYIIFLVLSIILQVFLILIFFSFIRMKQSLFDFYLIFIKCYPDYDYYTNHDDLYLLVLLFRNYYYYKLYYFKIESISKTILIMIIWPIKL